MKHLAEKINRHEHPAWLRRFPRLMEGAFWWFRFVYQRVRVVRRELRRHLPKGEPFHLLDAGCGEGLFLFELARRYPSARFTGLDINPHNVDFCRRYARACGLSNVALACADLSAVSWPDRAEHVLCVGVLHCVADDLAFLKNLHASTHPAARLYLYAPLQPRRFWPFFERWYRQWRHYEAIHGRHIYTAETLKRRLARAGWQVTHWQGTMHRLATAGFELYTLCFLGALHARHWWASAILGALVLPAALLAALLQRLDGYGSGSHPNGAWVVATKVAAQVHPPKEKKE